MPRCPSCGKGFKDPTAVANHMSQPASGCNTWVDNLVSLTDNFRRHTDSNTADLHFEMVDQMDVDTADYMGLDADLEYPVNVPPSPLQAVEQEEVRLVTTIRARDKNFTLGLRSWTRSMQTNTAVFAPQIYTIPLRPVKNGRYLCGFSVPA
jgi:hypothetical protein